MLGFQISLTSSLYTLLRRYANWAIPEKSQTGGVEVWNFQEYQGNSMQNFEGLIKNEVDFPRMTKEK